MSNVRDTDIFLINRGGIDYQVTAKDLKDFLDPPPAELVPLPDGVTLTLPKEMVVNKQSDGAGIIPHDPWITIDIRTSINTDDYLFCMCWPHFTGTGGDGIPGPSIDRDNAAMGYTINHPEAKPYDDYYGGCLHMYQSRWDELRTVWLPFEAFTTPFGFTWAIGNHLSFIDKIKKLDRAECQPYIIAYPKALMTFAKSREQAQELNGGVALGTGAIANVPEGSYFMYFYSSYQEHFIAKDGIWHSGKSFTHAEKNKWTDEDHAEMLDIAPMMVDITDWNFARVEVVD